ncbi:DUF2993 domain-containing protein [Phytoactinopolyspora alkaliphila]|uniref:DUF2993 domain-containing protein n=1 Tax=Phytoactinopolyspora alkaliphila TaxID=1783498 RepID=A0A6N9YLJ5_9ACTN|nr:DUF2993 domain-containing protein [Phytoactinopolyspora alkaliphila]
MRTFRRILIVLLVLAALAVAVDRIGAWVAGRMVADQVSRELTRYDVDSGSPDASVGGFPFLTQVVSGEYEEITIELPDVRADEVRMRDVELVATEVSASMSTLIERSGPVRAGRLDGTGLVDYSTVAALSGMEGLELAAASGGEVAVRLPVDVLGASLTLTGAATVSVDGNVVQLRVTELGSDETAGLPQAAQAQIDQIAGSVSVDVPLPALPYDLTIDSVRPAESGLAVSLSATDVPLSR